MMLICWDSNRANPVDLCSFSLAWMEQWCIFYWHKDFVKSTKYKYGCLLCLFSASPFSRIMTVFLNPRRAVQSFHSEAWNHSWPQRQNLSEDKWRRMKMHFGVSAGTQHTDANPRHPWDGSHIRDQWLCSSWKRCLGKTGLMGVHDCFKPNQDCGGFLLIFQSHL